LSTTKAHLSPNSLFLLPLLQPTKNPILTQHTLTFPMDPLSHTGAVQATFSSSSDEREDPLLSGDEEAERRPIRVLVDTSSDD
jgi:hypothetical protein